MKKSYSGRELQKKIRIGGIAFICLLIAVMAYRSSNRSSIIGAGEIISDANTTDSSPVGSGKESRLHLQDFHRVEVKDGKPSWEVRAKEAKFFAEENLTHVNDANLIFYREKNSKINVSAQVATLHHGASEEGNSTSSTASLGKAELEGNLIILVDDSVTIKSDYALYDAVKGEIVAPNDVVIEGPQFTVSGKGLRFTIDSQEIELIENVQSRFEKKSDV